MERDNRANRYSPETRERAVRMVQGNQGNYQDRSAAVRAVAPKIGCSRDTLRRWVAQWEIDTGSRVGVSSKERARIKDLERKVRELRQGEEERETVQWTGSPTNEILKKASAYFAPALAHAQHVLSPSGTELDRPPHRREGFDVAVRWLSRTDGARQKLYHSLGR